MSLRKLPRCATDSRQKYCRSRKAGSIRSRKVCRIRSWKVGRLIQPTMRLPQAIYASRTYLFSLHLVLSFFPSSCRLTCCVLCAFWFLVSWVSQASEGKFFIMLSEMFPCICRVNSWSFSPSVASHSSLYRDLRFHKILRPKFHFLKLSQSISSWDLRFFPVQLWRHE